MPAIKRTAADHWYSLCIREGHWSWTCASCGKYFPEGSRGGLDCSHIFSRKHYGTRFLAEPPGAVAHCTSCHFHLGGNPIEFARHAEELLGSERLQELERIKNDPLSGKGFRGKELQKAISAHFRKHYRLICDQRLDGVLGRIEFPNFEA